MTHLEGKGFTEDQLEAIAEASGKAYEAYYDLLDNYMFGFTHEQKDAIVDAIAADIKQANLEAEMDNAHS